MRHVHRGKSTTSLKLFLIIRHLNWTRSSPPIAVSPCNSCSAGEEVRNSVVGDRLTTETVIIDCYEARNRVEREPSQKSAPGR
jgi:hypothetical protein